MPGDHKGLPYRFTYHLPLITYHFPLDISPFLCYTQINK